MTDVLLPEQPAASRKVFMLLKTSSVVHRTGTTVTSPPCAVCNGQCQCSGVDATWLIPGVWTGRAAMPDDSVLLNVMATPGTTLTMFMLLYHCHNEDKVAILPSADNINADPH